MRVYDVAIPKKIEAVSRPIWALRFRTAACSSRKPTNINGGGHGKHQLVAIFFSNGLHYPQVWVRIISILNFTEFSGEKKKAQHVLNTQFCLGSLIMEL